MGNDTTVMRKMRIGQLQGAQMRDSNVAAAQALSQQLTEVSIAPPTLSSIRAEMNQSIASGNGS